MHFCWVFGLSIQSVNKITIKVNVNVIARRRDNGGAVGAETRGEGQTRQSGE